MTQQYNSTTYDEPATNEPWVTRLSKAHDGIETALTNDFGASDPSAAPGRAWDSTDAGRIWKMPDGSGLNPTTSRWEKLTAAGAYGFRDLRLMKIHRLDERVTVSPSSASPQTADLAWEDIDLTTVLDGAGVQDNDDLAVAAVEIRVRVTSAATDATDKGWVAFRRKGDTTDGNRVYAQVTGIPNEQTFVVRVDSGEAIQFQVDVGAGGTPSMAYSIELTAYEEQV